MTEQRHLLKAQTLGLLKVPNFHQSKSLYGCPCSQWTTEFLLVVISFFVSRVISFLILSGGGASITTSDILEFNKTTMEWEKIGQMSAPRDQHQMTSVDVTDFGCSL